MSRAHALLACRDVIAANPALKQSLRQTMPDTYHHLDDFLIDTGQRLSRFLVRRQRGNIELSWWPGTSRRFEFGMIYTLDFLTSLAQHELLHNSLHHLSHHFHEHNFTESLATGVHQIMTNRQLPLRCVVWQLMPKPSP